MQTAIVCLGSFLVGDDGVAPPCLQVLEGSHESPENMHLRELGTPGPELLKAVAKACAKVLEILAEWGSQPIARRKATRDVWWSRGGE